MPSPSPPCASPLGQGGLVNEPDADVHNEDGVANAFGIPAKVTDENHQQACADAEDHLALGGVGAGHIVGRHEEGAQEQTAGKNLTEHPGEDVDAFGRPGEHQGQNSHRDDVRGGNPNPDHALGDQVDSADEQCDGGNLTHAAADVPDEHIQHRGLGNDAALHVVHGQGGCTGNRVCCREDGSPVLFAGQHPGGHGHRIAQHQECTASQCGVQEVGAQAAEELLDNHDGKEVANDDGPIGQRDRTYKHQQHTRDGR